MITIETTQGIEVVTENAASVREIDLAELQVVEGGIYPIIAGILIGALLMEMYHHH